MLNKTTKTYRAVSEKYSSASEKLCMASVEFNKTSEKLKILS